MMQVERRINSQAQKLKAGNAPRQIKKGAGAIKQQPEKRAPGHPAAASKQHKLAQETVTVSKEYLDKLLKMSMLAESSQAIAKVAEEKSHVVLDPCQVPGLSQEITASVSRSNEPSKAQGGDRVRVAGQRNRSVHDQWLDDLAAQAEEQKMRREAERKQKKLPVVEKDYNPWGKPGCGAPMRTSSGSMPTDFHRKAVITGPRGIEGGHTLEPYPAPGRGDHGSGSTSPRWEPRQQAPIHSPPSQGHRHQGKDWAEDYNPWGKPGCGAPMRTSSGNVITDYRRKAVITGPNRDQELVAASYGQRDREQPDQYSSRPNVSSPTAAQPHTHLPYYDEGDHALQHHPYGDDPPYQDEDYNPWGKPGCGAPMATGPDTDYRRHAVITGPKSRALKDDQKSKNKSNVGAPPTKHTGAPPPKHSGSGHAPPPDMHVEGSSHTTSKPSFGRGPGPHVDSYMMKDRDEARRREKERMAFIQQQIAEKERKKMEEKRQKEEEDRKEEERLYKERMDAERRREMEAKAARERENKADRHKAMLRHRTEQARQDAQGARMEARALKSTHRVDLNSDVNPPARDPSHATLRPPPPRQTSTLRSPSLLHAAEQTSPSRSRNNGHVGGGGGGAPTSPPGNHHQHHPHGGRGFIPRRPEGSPPAGPRQQRSRIPRLAAKRSDGTAVVAGQAAAKCSAKGMTSTIHGPESGPTRRQVVAKKSRSQRELLARSPTSPAPLLPRAPPSPPVPALRKKLAPPIDAGSRAAPIPPLQQTHRAPPTGAVAAETREPASLSDATGGDGYDIRGSSSPPVPALKKKLASVPGGDGFNLPPIQPGSHGIVTDSVPPRKGQPPTSVDTHHHHQQQPTAAGSSAGGPPSTSMAFKDADRVHLPPVVVGPTHENPGDLIRPPTMTRQKRILQELAMLREQIITQKLNVDEKVRNTLARKLNAQ